LRIVALAAVLTIGVTIGRHARSREERSTRTVEVNGRSWRSLPQALPTPPRGRLPGRDLPAPSCIGCPPTTRPDLARRPVLQAPSVPPGRVAATSRATDPSTPSSEANRTRLWKKLRAVCDEIETAKSVQSTSGDHDDPRPGHVVPSPAISDSMIGRYSMRQILGPRPVTAPRSERWTRSPGPIDGPMQRYGSVVHVGYVTRRSGCDCRVMVGQPGITSRVPGPPPRWIRGRAYVEVR
jgi:hypothetical protein